MHHLGPFLLMLTLLSPNFHPPYFHHLPLLYHHLLLHLHLLQSSQRT